METYNTRNNTNNKGSYKMKKVIFAFAIALVLGFNVNQVSAQPFTGDMATDSCPGFDNGDPTVATPCQVGDGPEVYEAINHIFNNAGVATPAVLTDNGDTDPFRVANDSYWEDLSGGTAGSFAVVSISAANMNTLGVHNVGDLGSSTGVVLPQTGFTFLGDGSAANPFPGGNPVLGSNFGFSLNTVGFGGDQTYSSDPDLNHDGLDHMISFYFPQLEGVSFFIDTTGDGNQNGVVSLSADTYVLAWEDLPNGGDIDYNDTIFLVTKVAPVPEPITALLFSSGFAAMAARRRKARA